MPSIGFKYTVASGKDREQQKTSKQKQLGGKIFV